MSESKKSVVGQFEISVLRHKPICNPWSLGSAIGCLGSSVQIEVHADLNGAEAHLSQYSAFARVSSASAIRQ
jgi:hypothetical protein